MEVETQREVKSMWNFLKGIALTTASARLYRRFPWLVAAVWAYNLYKKRKAARGLA
jgi:hypothetical protein